VRTGRIAELTQFFKIVGNAEKSVPSILDIVVTCLLKKILKLWFEPFPIFRPCREAEKKDRNFFRKTSIFLFIFDVKMGGSEDRETWGNRASFLLACIGAAVGLGNIWRLVFLHFLHFLQVKISSFFNEFFSLVSFLVVSLVRQFCNF
jgi:hypothetical protein